MALTIPIPLFHLHGNFYLQIQSSPNKHLENVSRLQLYEYQLATAPSDSFISCTNGSKFSTNIENTGDQRLHSHTALPRRRSNAGHWSDDRSNTSEAIGSSSCGNGTGSPDNATSSHGNVKEEVCGNMERKIVGLLAQEVREVLPNAVTQTVSSIIDV